MDLHFSAKVYLQIQPCILVITVKNTYKYSPGTTAHPDTVLPQLHLSRKDISKYNSSTLAIIIKDISKHGPALFRQRMSSNTALHTGNYREKYFQTQPCHNCTYHNRISPNRVLLQSYNSQNQHSAPPTVLQKHPTLKCLGACCHVTCLTLSNAPQPPINTYPSAAMYRGADKSLARPTSFPIYFFSPGNRW
jgi:hypothetical protein